MKNAIDPLDVVVANLPLLLLVGGLLATLVALAAAVGLLVLLSGALFSFPEFDFNGTTLDGGWTLVRFGPLLAMHGLLAAVSAYGVWTEKAWSRAPAVAFWVAMVVWASVAAILHPVGGRFWFVVALCAVPILLATWSYLYFWGSVKVYYEGLRNKGGINEP